MVNQSYCANCKTVELATGKCIIQKQCRLCELHDEFNQLTTKGGFVTIQEAADAIGLPEKTIRSWKRSGVLLIIDWVRPTLVSLQSVKDHHQRHIPQPFRS